MPIQYFSRGPQGQQGYPGPQGQQGPPGPPSPRQYGMEMQSQTRNVVIFMGRKVNKNGDVFFIAEEFVKTSDSFAEGSGHGGMVSELVRDRIYAIYSIAKNDGTTDFCISDSFTEPSMPSEFTSFVLIGSIRSNSDGQLAKQIQIGNYFRVLEDVGHDYYAIEIERDHWFHAQLIAPPKSIVDANIRLEADGDYFLNLRYTGSDETGKGDRAIMAFSTEGHTRFFSQQVDIVLNHESFFEHYSEAELRAIYVSVSGWYMPNLGGF